MLGTVDTVVKNKNRRKSSPPGAYGFLVWGTKDREAQRLSMARWSSVTVAVRAECSWDPLGRR